MADDALREAIAQIVVEDLASDVISKIEKHFDSAEKKIEKTEKTTKQFSSTYEKASKSLTSTSGRFQGVAQGAAGGGIVAGALLGIPLVGQGLAAIVNSAGEVGRKMLTAVNTQKTLSTLKIQFEKALDDKGKQIFQVFDKNFFSEYATREAFARLSGIGVEIDKLTSEQLKPLATLAKAQGITDTGQLIQSILTGNLQANRGLSDTTLEQIKQMSAIAGQSTMHMRAVFPQILKVIQQNVDGIEPFAKQLSGTLERIQTVETAAEKLQVGFQEEIAGRALQEGGGVIEKLQAAQKIEKANFEAQSITATAGEAIINLGFKAIEKIVQYAGADTAPVPARAAGGRVSPGGMFAVQERGFELFEPDRPGKIISNSQSKDILKNVNTRNNVDNSTININPTINIPVQVTNGTINPQEIARVVFNTIEELARTTFRHNAGLNLK